MGIDICETVKTTMDNLNNFIANKCTSFILFSYVTLQSGRHVSIRADHRLGLLYMNIIKLNQSF
jgi:hypothetical protein